MSYSKSGASEVVLLVTIIEDAGENNSIQYAVGRLPTQDLVVDGESVLN